MLWESIFINIKTKDKIKDQSNLKEYFDCGESDENHVLFSNLKKKLLVNLKLKLLKMFGLVKHLYFEQKNLHLFVQRIEKKKIREPKKGIGHIEFKE